MSSFRLLYVTRRFRPLLGGLENTAMRLFGWSITYITVLFGAMAVDQLAGFAWPL